MIACSACQKREREIADAVARSFRPSEVFSVTGFEREDQGHRLYYSSQGTIPLCVARRLVLHRFNH